MTNVYLNKIKKIVRSFYIICLSPQVNHKLTWGGGYLFNLTKTTFFYCALKIELYKFV